MLNYFTFIRDINRNRGKNKFSPHQIQNILASHCLYAFVTFNSEIFDHTASVYPGTVPVSAGLAAV